MAIRKQYQLKVYSQDGTTLLASLTTDRPSDPTVISCKNVPTFRSQINGGQGECVLDLEAPFDDFDEGTTVDFMNVVRIYAVVNDDVALTQTTTLIYSGFVSKYEPYLEEDGSEGVRVTCLGLVTLLALSYYKSGSDFEVSHGGEDPTVIGKAVVTHFNTIYGGSLISYDASSVPSTVGTAVTVAFTDQKWFDALKKTADLAGTDWWWSIAADGKYYFKAKPASATHTFTVGREVQSLSAPKDSEKVINDVRVRWHRTSDDTDQESDYSDATSQATFGTGSGTPTGKRTEIISDPGLGDSAAAGQRGNKAVNDNKDEKIKATLLIRGTGRDGTLIYDIEGIEVGDTCKILNYDASSTFFGSNMLIASVEYLGDFVRLELEEEPASFGIELQRMIESAAAAAATAATGGSASSVSYADKETPSGTINGTNATFTLAHTPSGSSLQLFLNGVLQNSGAGNDFTASGTSIVFISPPPSGSTLLAWYRY